jgi:serine/threonine protein kinase HipA of HipAB toxin-antitoxin module
MDDIEYAVSREATITATEGEFARALQGSPVVVGHRTGSDDETVGRNLFTQQPGLVAVRAVCSGRIEIVLLAAQAVDTDAQAIAFAEAALKSAGLI